MSTERTEMLEILQSEIERYRKLEKESVSRLLEIMVTDSTKVTVEMEKEREEVEEEIETLRKLIGFIDFKLKVLNVNEFAS